MIVYFTTNDCLFYDGAFVKGLLADRLAGGLIEKSWKLLFPRVASMQVFSLKKG